MEIGKDAGHRQRMGDVGFAALARLAGVRVTRQLIGALDERDVGGFEV
jgi:hypothetical protein